VTFLEQLPEPLLGHGAVEESRSAGAEDGSFTIFYLMPVGVATKFYLFFD
jgi:hypothetical protein